MKMVILEIPSKIWNFLSYLKEPIDRSPTLVSEYLVDEGIVWDYGDHQYADFYVYKEENIRNGLLSIRRVLNEYQKRIKKYPYMNINGEAQEHSRCSYALADPERTYAVAPGDTFKRIYFPTRWRDPHPESWDKRINKVCWIGRPLPERIKAAEHMRDLGIPFDVYSSSSWGIPEWKGYGSPETAQKYKYQIVIENSLQDKYHSEKLINSMMDGCVTFYVSDPELATPLDGAYLSYTEETLVNREKYSGEILRNMTHILFSDKWEPYSFRSFFDKIINEARSQLS